MPTPAAEAFLRAAAAARTSKLGTELAHITALEAAWEREPLVAALGAGVQFRRFRASDLGSILEAGPGRGDTGRGGRGPGAGPAGGAGAVPRRLPASGASGEPAAPLAPDLVAGLKRLKLAKVRAIASEVLAAAKVQRWAPFLRAHAGPLSTPSSRLPEDDDDVLISVAEARIAAPHLHHKRGRKGASCGHERSLEYSL